MAPPDEPVGIDELEAYMDDAGAWHPVPLLDRAAGPKEGLRRRPTSRLG